MNERVQMQVALQWRRVKRGIKRVILRYFCEIDSYDPDIGCNMNCNGYKKEKTK